MAVKSQGKAGKVKEFIKMGVKREFTSFVKSRDWFESPDFCLRLLNGSITKKDQEKLENRLRDCAHAKDWRSLQEYATELMLNWLIEDGLVSSLQDIGLDATLCGNDKTRKLLPGSDLGYNPDLTIYNGNSDLPAIHAVEIKTSYNGFFANEQALDLRDEEYKKHLDKHSLLGLDLGNRKLFYIPAKRLEELEVKKFDKHPVYEKPAHRVFLDEIKFHHSVHLKPALKEIFSLQQEEESESLSPGDFV